MEGKKWEELVLPECTCLGLNFRQFFISYSKIHHRPKNNNTKKHGVVEQAGWRKRTMHALLLLNPWQTPMDQAYGFRLLISQR